jgi:hypothetical protein
MIHKLSKNGHNGSSFVVVLSVWTEGFSTCVARGQFLYMHSFKHPQRKKSITDRSSECTGTGHATPDITKCYRMFILIHATYSTHPLSLNKFWADMTLCPSWCAHCAPYPIPPPLPNAGQKFILKCVSWLCTSLYMYMVSVPLWRQ